MSTPGDARIVDRGYRHYTGERRGRRGAHRALFVNSVQRALGLRRKFRFKLIPISVAVMSYLFAIVFVGVAALLPDGLGEETVPDYASYYGFVTAAILLFVSIVVPEMLCVDRRTGMLGMYLAAPLTRDTYLAAKAAAVLAILSIVTIGPLLLLIVGYSLVDVGPTWPIEGFGLLARIVLAGGALALFFTAFGLAVSALTDRRAFASAGIALTALVSAAVVSALVETSVGMPAALRVLDVFNLPFELVRRIYGERGSYPEVGTATLAAGWLGWVTSCAALVRWRYQRLVVTK
ncbi:MAG: hypothetical protein OEY23_11950 [Acidimicrobiia bacterium]|nr:hypothetical protein [Acidimicrobiia bacterium]